MWIVSAQQHTSPEETVKGFTESCISSAVDGTDGDMLWNGRVGVLGVSVRKMDTPNVQMETATLIGKGRQNVTCCVY
jgi:hypothetical protein